ncbi:MAG: glycoside hydrolase family 28 protein [Lachnospiraceae bacterium]|nr:glycoside hydrolase family 28 protein [Lachnospiraceae bacterium]
MQELHILQTEYSITAWWEKPEEFIPGDKFIFRLTGPVSRRESAVVTHVTAKGLLPDSEYIVEVRYMHEGEPVWELSRRVRTEKERPKIDVTQAPYNAVGDGVTMNRSAIQRAIDDCPAGGTVVIPEGIFKTGALNLHSDMELFISEGGVLLGTAEPSDYEPRIRSRFEGIEGMCYASLINIGELGRERGITVKNVRITGGGTICGGGRALMENTIGREKMLLSEAGFARPEDTYGIERVDTVPGRVRGRLINISCAENIRISDLILRDGPAWNIHMIYSRNIVTDAITLISKHIWNGDGWDPDSSSDCVLFGSQFFTGDDAVAVKSGKNPEGNALAIPTERVRVFDCKIHYGHGFAIGSEMSGGVRDVKFWDCDLAGSYYGLEVKATAKRGGYVKDISFTDCVTPRIQVHSVKYNDDGEGAEHPPVFSGFHFRNIRITGRGQNEKTEIYEDCQPVVLRGFEEPGYALTDVTFRNVSFPENAKNPVEAEFVSDFEINGRAYKPDSETE